MWLWRPTWMPQSSPCSSETGKVWFFLTETGVNNPVERGGNHNILTRQLRKHGGAAACCGKSKFAISSGWVKNRSVCHPDDNIVITHPDEIPISAKSSGWHMVVCYVIQMTYRHVSNVRRTLIGNKIVDHSDVVGASPVGAAPTTSSFST